MERLKSRGWKYHPPTCYLIDFLATFIELGEATYPKKIGNRQIDPLEGKSLTQSLIMKNGMDMTPSTSISALTGHLEKENGNLSRKGGKWELYNLDNDRTELKDLSLFKKYTNVEEMV